MDAAKRRAFGRFFSAPCALLCAAGIAVFLAPDSPAAAREAATPLEVYGRLPSLEDVALSPNGNRVAYVQTNNEERTLLIRDLASPAVIGAARVGDVKLRSLVWIDDENLLCTTSSTGLPPIGFNGPKIEWYQLLYYSLPKHKLKGVEFAVSGEKTFNVAIGESTFRELNGATVVFVPGLYVTDRTLPGLFQLDVASGRMRIISKGADRTDWLIDQSGRIAAELVYQDQKKRWEFFARKDGNLAMVAAGESPVDVPSIVGFGPDGDDIVMRFIENGDPVWKRFVLKDQSWGPPLFNGETLHTAILDPRNGRLLGGSLRVGEDRYYFFDNELQAHWDAMLRAFPAERVTFESAANDFHRIIVKVFGAKDGYIYALFDWYTHKAIVLGKLYEGLGEVGEVKSIAYPAADGLTIPAYLTLPPGAAGQSAANLPLIVFPHGGPQIADSGGFDWWAQALAVQGYAVLQPNYRGSSMNFRFVEAGFGEWGRKMQTDLSDGVRYLAGQHLIDPKRVCIVGASYGGYAALAGMTLDPGVYRCAVSVAGLSDLKRMLQWSDRRIGHSDNLNQRYWDRFMAVTGPHDPRLQSISPIDHIEQIGGPILLIHGRDDTVVPYEQSEVMASALKRAGKPFDFLTLKLEDHWLSHSATRLEMLRAVVTFLKANNPP